MKKLEIIPKGTVARDNAECGIAGECASLLNMREADKSLVTVGKWNKLGDVADGERVMLIDRRADADYYLSCMGEEVRLHGVKQGGIYTEIQLTLCELETEPMWMCSVGAFVVIATSCGYRHLRFSNGSYKLLNFDDAIPQMTLTATNVAELTAIIEGEEFAEAYSSWGGTLKSKDVKTLSAKVKSAYSELQAKVRQSGGYMQPVAARYALSLWDGNYAWVSAPVVIGSGLQLTEWQSTDVDSYFMGYSDSKIKANRYDIGVSVVKQPASDWLPLIKSIDILVSDEVEPFDDDMGISCRGESSTTEYYLSYRLERKEHAAVVAGLVNPEKWKVAARITNIGEMSQKIQALTRSDIYNTELARADIADLVADTNHETIADAGLSMNGRLYSAGHVNRMKNSWQSPQYWSGEAASVPCEVIVTAKLNTVDGVAVKVDKHEYDYTPKQLNALVAYPDARAYDLNIKVLSDSAIMEWSGTLTGADESGLAYFVNDDFAENEFSEGYSFYMPTEQKIEEDASSEFVVSESGNPFVVTQRRNIGCGKLNALGVVSKSLYSNVFGRYPVYAFSTEGIYAISYKALGDYKDSQLIDRQVVADAGCVAYANDKVFFVSTDGELCSVSGKNVTVIRHVEGVTRILWIKAYEEVLLLYGDGSVESLMPSGRSYKRAERVNSLCGDGFDAVAVTDGCELADLNQELSAVVQMGLLTHPIAVAGSELTAPVLLSVNMAGDFKEDSRLELQGSNGTGCEWRVLSEIQLNGTYCHPVVTQVIAPPCRLVRIFAEGEARSGTILRDMVMTYC